MGVSVYLADDALGAVTPRMKGGEGRLGDRSPTIARMIDRYAETVRRSMPRLSKKEWALVVDALNGTLNEPAANIALLWAGIADSCRMDRLHEKHQLTKDEAEDFLTRLQAMSYAEELAIADQAERYWAAVSRGENPEIPG